MHPTTVAPTTYPPAVTSALRSLRRRSVMPAYVSATIRAAYPSGDVPAPLQVVADACRDRGATWSKIDAALRGLT